MSRENCFDALRQVGERQGGAAETQEIEITTTVTNEIKLYQNKCLVP